MSGDSYTSTMENLFSVNTETYVILLHDWGVFPLKTLFTIQKLIRTVFVKQKDVILTNDAWNVIVNLDFSSYEQTIAKLKDDLLYMQKFKTPLAPVYEMNHLEYIYIYEGDSKSKGKIHLTAVIQVTVSNFTYYFST